MDGPRRDRTTDNYGHDAATAPARSPKRHHAQSCAITDKNAIANAKREQRPGRRGHAVDGWATNYCSIDIFEDDDMFVTERDGSFTRTVEVPASATITQIEQALDAADVYDY